MLGNSTKVNGIQPIELGLLIQFFIAEMIDTHPNLKDKKFIRKIIHKLTRYHKRHNMECSLAQFSTNRVLAYTESFFSDKSIVISLGALVWILYHRNKDVLKCYDFDKVQFDRLNKYVNAQGVILVTARVANKLEEGLINDYTNRNSK